MVFNKISIRYCILGGISLLAGLFTYLLFRPNTYVARFIISLFSERYSFDDKSWVINNSFVEFYFADFLWAFSFACFLHAIFVPRLRGSLLCALLTSIFGVAYEGLQFFGVVSGTGDIVDCLFYLIGGMIVVAINSISIGGK